MIKTTPSDFRLQTSYFILVKDYVVAAYLSDRLFLAAGHIFIKDFLQRFTCGLFCHDSA